MSLTFQPPTRQDETTEASSNMSATSSTTQTTAQANEATAIAQENASFQQESRNLINQKVFDEDEKNYEIALALNNNNPDKVTGHSEFKRGGSKYKPFKWYNYRHYDMPAKPLFLDGKTLIAYDWVFPNTATGKTLQNQILMDQNYRPTEVQLKNLAIERGKAVEKLNTDLDRNPGGNFDYLFDGYRIDVNVKCKFGFEDGIETTAQQDFKTIFFDAITAFWTNSGYGLEVIGDYPVKFIPINITATEVSSNEHFPIDVKKEYLRPNVIYDMNIYVGETPRTIAHEFGHCLGLYDEYESTGGFLNKLENISPLKRLQYKKDTSALMNKGSELRNRYFTHFLDAALPIAPKGVTFKLKAPK